MTKISYSTQDQKGDEMSEIATAERKPLSIAGFLKQHRPQPGATRTGRSRSRLIQRVIAGMLMLLVVLSGVFGASAAMANNDADESMKLSFYKASSILRSFFSENQQPGKEAEFSAGWQEVLSSPSSAGSMLGYSDPKFGLNLGYLDSLLSGSSSAIGYDSLVVVDSEQNGDSRRSSAALDGMVGFAHYGATLNALGIDNTSTGLASGFMELIGGAIIWVLFVLSGLIDAILNFTIDLLAKFNPFKLFFYGVQAVSPGFADSMVGGTSDPGIPVGLVGLATWIGDWYRILVSLSWTVIVPIFFGVFLLSLLLFKKMDKGSAVKKLVVRMMFIVLGLPLLGSMYTGMLDSMSDPTAANKLGSTRVVLSTFVDFEGWAKKSRLAVPEGAVLEWNTNSNTPSAASQIHLRDTALAINASTYRVGYMFPGINDAKDEMSVISWASDSTEETREISESSVASLFLKTSDMLGRYMGSTHYSAATFESDLKGQLANGYWFKNSDGASTQVAEWFELFDLSSEDMNSDDEAPGANPIIASAPGTGLQASQASGGSVTKFSSNNTNCFNGLNLVGSQGQQLSCNLSPLSMYNYLNADFGDTSLKMYSSLNTQSEATRSIHTSVNLIGSGVTSMVYWANAAVLLGSFVIIGFAYTFTLIISSFRRTVQILVAVPFATLGALAAIGKVLVYAIALLLEVIVTIFMFQVIQQFLMTLPQIFEAPFELVLNGGMLGNGAGFVNFLMGNSAFPTVVALLSIVGVVAFTVMALRVRKSIVKAIEEVLTKLVEKLTDTNIGMPAPAGGKAGALAGGLAAGAGAAAGSRMLGAKQNGDKTGPTGISGTTGDSEVKTEPVNGDADGGEQKALPEGNGDPGNPPGDGNSVTDISSETHRTEIEAGRQVEANGLSQPQPQSDAGDTAFSSAEESMNGYAEADKERVKGVASAGETVGHTALAVGHAYAGDSAGAAKHAGAAAEAGGKTVAAGERAKAAEKQAGQSSIDAGAGAEKSRKKIARAERVSQAGSGLRQAGEVSSAGAGGAGKAPSPKQLKGKSAQPKAPQATSSAQKPVAAPRSSGKPSAASPQREVKSQGLKPAAIVPTSTPSGTKSTPKPKAPKADSRPPKVQSAGPRRKSGGGPKK